MRLIQVGQLLAGSLVVYATVVACGSSGDDGTGRAHAGGAGGSGGASGGKGGVESGINDGTSEDGYDSSELADGTNDSNDGSVFDALTDPVPEALADVSGTRLKRHFLQGADGSKEYDLSVWYDSQLGENCTYAMAADQKLRCLPGSPGDVYYLDGNCTQMVALFWPQPTGCPALPAPKYIFTEEPATYCPSPSGKYPRHVFPLTGSLPTIPLPLFKLTPTCQPTNNINPIQLAYTYGAEVPASTFVEGTAATDP